MSKGYRTAFWVSTAAFVVVSALAGAGWLRGADMLALRSTQLVASGSLDLVSDVVSLAGGVFITTGLVLALVVVLYLRGRRLLATRLATGFVAITLIEVLLKLFLPVPPLPLEYLRSTGEEWMIRLPHPYPSGHMMRTVFLAGALALLWPVRPVWTATGVLLTAMAVTRVYLGVHWTSDVLGGALLGVAALAWAFGGENAARQHKRNKHNEQKERVR